LTDRWLSIVPGSLRSCWADGDGEGSKGAEGSCPGPNGSPFYPTIPGLVCCSDFKGGSKARCFSSTNSSSVAIPNAIALIEYHTVALEPVLEHPRLLAVSGLRRRAGPDPRVMPRIVARRLAQYTRGASRAPTGPLGRQLTDTLVERRSLPSFAPLGR
jgi:hypothetical protein